MADPIPTARDRPAEESIPEPSSVPAVLTTEDNGYAYGSFPAIDAASASSQPINKPIPTGSGKARVLSPDLLRGLLMMLMAMDHLALGLHTWSHGTGREQEGDGLVVRRWNYAAAYIVRTLTHLCAPGFTLLLGMGIVYLGRSRTRLGWSSTRLARYFLVRCIVLTIVTTLFGLILTGGQLWFFNAVLFALAIDYLLAGLLWLAMTYTEEPLAKALEKLMSSKGAEDEDDASVDQPLLADQPTKDDVAVRAQNISWHIHNVLLVVLSVVTIAWNHWASPNGGHCASTAGQALTSSAEGAQPPALSPWEIFVNIWFWPVMSEHVMSGFPPMAWVSFSILGLLYGRIMIARTWTPRAVALGHTFAGLLMTIIFVLTRVLRVGNLSEDCLQLPEQEQHPDANPYLVSVPSFFYIVKYPPDVAFWAFTLAGNFFLLAIFGAIPVRISKRMTMLLDFGTTALFFYIVHLLVIFGLAEIFNSLFGHDTGVPDAMKPGPARGIDNLWGYFGIWALGMLILWPICRAYSRFKATKSPDSLWRFF